MAGSADAPGNWEHSIGESIGNGPDRTFTHYSTNYDPQEVDQPSDDDKRTIFEFEIYHDAGNTEYYAIITEATQFLNEDGEVIETVRDRVVEKTVVQVDEGYVSPGYIGVESHENAESLIHEKAEEMMKNHP